MAAGAEGTINGSGLIGLEVDKVSTLRKGECRCSKVIEVEGIPWSVEAKRDGGDLCVYLKCLEEEMPEDTRKWKLKLNVIIDLLNADSSKMESKTAICELSFDRKEDGGARILPWEDLIDKSKGFIKDDKIAVEVRFAFHIIGMRTPIDFTDPTEPFNDLALVIEGEKVYVNKGILAIHSPVFKAMLYSNFGEKNKTEIELKGVEREEFVAMLSLIYYGRRTINAHQAEFLLVLGDRFQIKRITDMAEQKLLSTERIPMQEKLRIADQFGPLTAKLMDHCLARLWLGKEAQAIKDSPIYDDLSEATKEAICDRLQEADVIWHHD